MNEEEIVSLLSSFKGAIKQKVPIYSAVKVDGKRLYKSARQGETVDTPVRDVFIDSIKLIGFNLPKLQLEISCSKGTYIRTIANDIGENIGCGAYLSVLKRNSFVNYSLAEA